MSFSEAHEEAYRGLQPRSPRLYSEVFHEFFLRLGERPTYCVALATAPHILNKILPVLFNTVF